MLALLSPVGPRTQWLVDLLTGPFSAQPAPAPSSIGGDARDDLDLHRAMLTAHELSYGGVAAVDDRFEHHPALIAAVNAWEAELLDAVRAELGDPDDVPIETFFRALLSGDGASMSGWMLEHATMGHLREEAAHRSIYQRQEADPHTFGIPRLRGDAKAALVTIQADEYGEGVTADMHCELFGHTLRGLGLDATPHAWAEHVGARTLATVNLVRAFGRSRRHRGALVGHLALFELASVPVMSALSRTYARLGCNSWSRLFFDVHVVADAAHQNVALHDLVIPLLEAEPDLDADVRFGARALAHLEGRLTEHVLARWEAGESSLEQPLPEPTGPLSALGDVTVGTDPRQVGSAWQRTA